MSRILLCALVVSLCPCAPAPVFADEPAKATWPQWRGPTRDGRSHGEAWPKSIDENHLKQQWRVELGQGYSGPIVAHDRVFTVESTGDGTELVRALDRDTGKQLWEKSWPGVMSVPFFARENGSWVRATPAFDGSTLYVAGMRDVLVAIDAKTGDIRWRVDFTKRYKSPLPSFGFVCSPLVLEGFVYVQAGGGFVKLDAKTGESVWRTLADKGGMNGSAFSSPVVATIAEQRQLVVQTRTAIAGVDIESGDVLWSQKVEAFRGMNILTPTVVGDAVFTSTYGGKSNLWNVRRDGDTYNVSQSWTAKPQGYMSSPIVIDGHAYHHLRNQRVVCIELATGDVKWTTTARFGKYWSMIERDGRILALDQRGSLLLLDATPEKFNLIEKRELADDTWAHIAKADDQLFIRELEALTVYRWRDPAEQ